MRLVQLVALCLSLVYSGQTTAQALGYQDATVPLGAVGMMKVSIQGAEYLKKRCVARFPALQQEIESNLMIWRTTEAAAIRKTEARWPAMAEQEPKFMQMLIVTENSIQGVLDSFDKMPPDVRAQVYSGTCHKHFADLASGIWRQRTPNAYRYLDELN